MSAAVEAAAKAIFELAPVPRPWTTWEERLALESEHRGDKSWSGPVERSRESATAALDAALPHLTESLASVIGDARDRSRKERDVTKVSLEEWMAAAITEELKRRIQE